MKLGVSHSAFAALAAISLVVLPACTKVEDEQSTDMTTREETGQTLAGVLADEDELSRLVTAADGSGLSSVLDGKANYTVLAPDDAAFDSLGERLDWLTAEGQRPILAALLRDHLVPGALTPDAISKAIADQGGSVEMKTYGDGNVTFTMEGESIVATGADGSKATMSSGAIVTSNGVVIPVDGFLHELPETGAAQ